ncbi:hypothetical protein GGR26_001047 [Lewinella marina]|uniref:Uncharacterized protein n=1 Tax=Neolewinella marina TaxID=438751 RepID=A0A2G0CHX6_9BACT|nr:hypothetical protein [Neolewinella marina]NJB85302.1 hypothetical protein [Neolewinella marina]PHK99582.1 hypothetical protein CGL56_00560 [Neolewinella marina]
MKAPLPYLWLLLGALVLAAPACTSVQSLVEAGDYEATIELAQRRLTGKQKKNPRLVAALETAVNRANEEDVNRAAFLRQASQPDWVRIHAIYDNLKRRQDALRPLLPLYDKDGRKATFRFVHVEDLVVESQERAAAQLYDQALAELAAGRRGDKSAARDAYHTLERIDRYAPNYRDTRRLVSEAETLGRVYITVEVANESRAFLPAGFEEELLRLRTAEMDDRWRSYDLGTPRRNVSYDYRARIAIRDLQVSPERISERSYLDERKVVDGEEYVLDGNGNVAKDSLGNDLTRPREIIVQAEVLEVLQQKTALVTGSVELYDLRDGRLIDAEDLTAEAHFENYASTYRGDPRALSPESRRRIGNQPRRFPSDADLILDAVAVLKPQLQHRLVESNRLI